MVKKTVQFLGVLANVNSSIVKFKPGRGFFMEAVSGHDGAKLIAQLENTTPFEMERRLFIDYHCINQSEYKLVAMRNSFEAEVDETKHIFDSLFSPTTRFENEEINGYLLDVLRLMRLFREGNICMPLWYYFLLEGTTPQHFFAHFSHSPISEEQFSLSDDEVPVLLAFLRDTKLPFKRDFLQLALENFEQAYEGVRPSLAFLSLMISLEILLNPSNNEIRHRLSRNAAVLLGRDFKDSTSIFSEVKKMYDKRSTLVHSGKADITSEDVRKLRHYVRDSIKTIDRIDKDKDAIMEILDSTGFNDKPWLT